MQSRCLPAVIPLCTVFCAAGIFACSDDDTLRDTANEPEFRGYALCVDVPSPVGSTGFILAVDELAEGTLTLNEGVEVGGGGSTCATGLGYAFVGTADSPVVTRYERDDSGIMIPGPRVSFFNILGSVFAGRGRAFQFLSEERALYVDRTTGIVVVWNPTEMSVIESIQLEGYEIEGTAPSIVPVLVGEQRDDVLMFVRYNRGGVQLKRSALISLNPETLEYTVTTEDRCGGFFNDVETSDGTIYMASSTFVTAQQVLDLSQDEPCMLRVLPGETQFDPDFYVELRDLTGGLPTGGILRGPGDGALIYTYDSELQPPGVTTFQVVGSEAWRPFLIEDLNAFETAVELPDFPVGVGSVSELFESQGRRYIPRIELLEGRAVLQDVTDPTTVRDGLTVIGGFFIGGGDLVR